MMVSLSTLNFSSSNFQRMGNGDCLYLMEAAQTEKERQKEINQLAHNTKNAQEEVVRNILTVHEALQPEQSLLKQVLVDFYVSNREDHIKWSSIPVAKRTKGNLIEVFFTHAHELIEM